MVIDIVLSRLDSYFFQHKKAYIFFSGECKPVPRINICKE